MGCTLGTPSHPGKLPAKDEAPRNNSPITASDSETSRHTRRTASRRRPRIPSHIPKDPSGWPARLLEVAGDALQGLTPLSAKSFKRIEKIGSGTYGNVLKAKDLETGRMMALKKVLFRETDVDSMTFMAREITVLRRLDHPNVVRLEGIVVSRVFAAIYLVFEYMEHDLTGLLAAPGINFSESQVKCYMKQLLSGLEHCHSRGVLHRDLKCANLLIDNKGILKIADFGLARIFESNKKEPLTNRVISLWYRPPELLLGEIYYGVGIDLWSVGCILAEMFYRRPILQGTSEVDQLNKIWKLCGAAPATSVWPIKNHKRCIFETFKNFPALSLPLIDTLLSLEPSKRGTATAALRSAFFTSEPFACDPSSLPQYPPSKEIDVKRRLEEANRPTSDNELGTTEAKKKTHAHTRRSRVTLASGANAELQSRLERQKSTSLANMMNKSRKFPPPHQDGAVGTGLQVSDNGSEDIASSSNQDPFGERGGNIAASSSRNKEDYNLAASHSSKRTTRQAYDHSLMELNRNTEVHRKDRGKEVKDFF